MSSTLSPEQDATARKSLTAFLRAVESIGQNALAEACGVDDSTISRDKSAWGRFCAELAFAGFKVVPTANVCYPADHVERLQYFAAIGIKHAGDVPTLDFDA